MLPGEALLFVTAFLLSILHRSFSVESTDTLFVPIFSTFLSTSAWLVEEELLTQWVLKALAVTDLCCHCCRRVVLMRQSSRSLADDGISVLHVHDPLLLGVICSISSKDVEVLVEHLSSIESLGPLVGLSIVNDHIKYNLSCLVDACRDGFTEYSGGAILSCALDSCSIARGLGGLRRQVNVVIAGSITSVDGRCLFGDRAEVLVPSQWLEVPVVFGLQLLYCVCDDSRTFDVFSLAVVGVTFEERNHGLQLRHKGNWICSESVVPVEQVSVMLADVVAWLVCNRWLISIAHFEDGISWGCATARGCCLQDCISMSPWVVAAVCGLCALSLCLSGAGIADVAVGIAWRLMGTLHGLCSRLLIR